MDAIMNVIQPVIDVITGLINGDVEISSIIAMIKDFIGGIIGG